MVLLPFPPTGKPMALKFANTGVASRPRRIVKSDTNFNRGIRKIAVRVLPVISSFTLDLPSS